MHVGNTLILVLENLRIFKDISYENYYLENKIKIFHFSQDCNFHRKYLKILKFLVMK